MVKLLKLVKSHDDFRAQSPRVVAPDDSAAKESAPSTAAASPKVAGPSAPSPRHPSILSLAHSSQDFGVAPESEQQASSVAPVPVMAPAPQPPPGLAAPLPPKREATTSARRDPGEAPIIAKSTNWPVVGVQEEPLQAQPDRSCEKLYSDALQVESRLCEAAAMEAISPGRLLAAAQEAEHMAAYLAAEPARDDSLLALALGTYPKGEGFVLPHSVNVAILAAFVAYQLPLPQPRLTATVLAGLTHDIGNVNLPSGLLYKEEPLTNGELDAVRKRPTYSHDLLLALGQEFQPIAEIATQVYERLDGSGYPEGLEGDQILVEARILGAVDFFETTIHPRPYKDSAPGEVNFGIQTLMRMAGQFGQDVLKALVRSVGLFPVGTYVHLSTGEIAQVLRGSRDNPMRPVVEVVFDKKKRRAEPRRHIDLVESPHLYVSKPCSNRDLVELKLIDAPPAAGEAATADEPDERIGSGTAGTPE